MADPAAWRTALGRLGFSNEAAAIIVADGYDNLSEYESMTDEDVTSLCKTVRRPGGTIQQDGNDAPNPGLAVSTRAELNLKLTVFWLRFRKNTSRTTAPADILLNTVREFRHHYQSVNAHEDPDVPKDIIDPKDWPKTFDAIKEHLHNCLGVTGIPLEYVIRENVTPKEDPADGYATKERELIARAPIDDPPVGGNPAQRTAAFKTDNQKVWELLAQMCRDKDCWTYIKTAQRSRDGRAAYNALYNHYLGPNSVDNMANSAERKLQSLSYTGEKRRWNFDKYTRLHVEQHQVLEGLTRFGYAGIDERSKVRYLIDGIKTNAFDSVKAQIFSTAALRTDFEGCVTLYKDFISQSTKEPTSSNISEVSTDRRGGNSNGQKDEGTIGPDKVQDRYYKAKEYKKLTKEAKLKLKKLREARDGGDPNPRDQKRVKLNKNQMKAIVKEITSKIAEVNTEGDDDNGSVDSTSTARTGNTNNAALTRQR